MRNTTRAVAWLRLLLAVLLSEHPARTAHPPDAGRIPGAGPWMR